MMTGNSNRRSTKIEIATSLGLSRSSLYYQPKKPAQDLATKKLIEMALAKHKSYGHKRIALELGMNKKKVRRVMKKFNLKPYRRRVNQPVKAQDINKPIVSYQNLIKAVVAERPNQIWVADFTYLPWQGRFIYVATVMDLFTREVIGYAVSSKHDRWFCLEALAMAIIRTNSQPEYHHSDQGSEYDSEDYLKRLTENKISISMSQKASPWENGFQESFYAQFKVDLGRPDQFETLGELTEAIYLQIHYYNHQRIHTSLKMSPIKFKNQYLKSNNINRKTNPQQLRQSV